MPLFQGSAFRNTAVIGIPVVPSPLVRRVAGMDQMSELDLIAELSRVIDACERLNRHVALAAQRRRFISDAQEVARAARDAQTALAELNRLMDRRRAVEGHLMRVRGQLRPLSLEE